MAILCGCPGSPYGGGAQTYRLPWPDATGVYSQQNVEIQTYDNPESLSGRLAHILISPSELSGQLVSPSPVGRYVRASDGTLWPADPTTLEGTAIYAHFERLYAIDQETGASDRLHWPAQIGLKTPVEDGGVAMADNNALYEATLDAILLLPFSQAPPALPIALNGGVLAHEHFHALFYAVVEQPIFTATGQLPSMAAPEIWSESGAAASTGDASESVSGLAATSYLASNRVGDLPSPPSSNPAPSSSGRRDILRDSPAVETDFVLRAMNEGFADFMGWVYTGDPEFIGKSLASAGRSRSLAHSATEIFALPFFLAHIALVKSAALSPDQKRGTILSFAYQAGTRYSRFLKDVTIALARGDSSFPARKRGAAVLVKALPALAVAAQKAYATSTPLATEAGIGAVAAALPAAGSPSSSPGALAIANPELCAVFSTVLASDDAPETPRACARAPSKSGNSPAARPAPPWINL